jgi:hypothetical protein
MDTNKDFKAVTYNGCRYYTDGSNWFYNDAIEGRLMVTDIVLWRELQKLLSENNS